MDLRELRWLIANEAMNMWRFRWVALFTAWVVALGGWAYVLTMPDVYESRARVFVDTDSVLRPLLKGLAVEPNTANQLAMMTRALTSRPQLEAVAQETGLADRAVTPAEYERLLQGLGRKIGIDQVRRQQIYTISFADFDPVMATQVVQSLLDDFIERSLQGDRTDAAQAQRFIRQQLDTYEARLDEAEQRLADFKRENVGLMPGQDGGYYERLQRATASVQALKARIETARERRDVLRRQLDGEGPIFSDGTRPTGTPLDATIQSFERQLSDLLLRYTDKYPEVVSTRETLADLYRMRDQQLASSFSDEAAGTAGAGINPVYQELRLALSDAEVAIAAHEAELREEERLLAYLRSQVDTIPEVEAQLNRLNRDYDVVKGQYEVLLKRLESARMAEDVQSDTESVKFEIIEPPRVPLFPTGPPRLLLSMAVLAAALGAGLGLAFLLSKQKPIIFTLPSLQAISRELPVYGIVERTAALAPGRRHLVFLGCVAGLLAVFGVVLVEGPDIRGLVEGVLQQGGLRA